MSLKNLVNLLNKVAFGLNMVLVRKEIEVGTPKVLTTEELINYGIVNIDKPKGPTSHQVSDFVKRILKVSKAGHSGSLDPAVTGLLPVATGRATRIVQSLLKSGKEYVGILHFHKELPGDKIRDVFQQFVGKIMQLPPVKSAVKRRLRERTVYYLKILEIDGKDVLFVAGTQAGTYIRKLCHDIGLKAGVGAHMAELRRTKVGPFDESNKVTLQDLSDAFHYYKEGKDKWLREIIIPIEAAVRDIPKVWVMDNAVESLKHGVDLKVPGVTQLDEGIEPDMSVALMTGNNELIALGTAKMSSSKIVKEKNGIAVLVHKVFLN